MQLYFVHFSLNDKSFLLKLLLFGVFVIFLNSFPLGAHTENNTEHLVLIYTYIYESMYIYNYARFIAQILLLFLVRLLIFFVVFAFCRFHLTIDNTFDLLTACCKCGCSSCNSNCKIKAGESVSVLATTRGRESGSALSASTTSDCSERLTRTVAKAPSQLKLSALPGWLPHSEK